MRGLFGAPHPKNYPICVLLTLPVKDFISDPAAASEAEELIVENINRFNIKASDNILIACNTAHILVPKLQHRTGIHFDSLVASVQQDIRRRDIKKVGVLASPVSLEKNVHGLTGLEIIGPSDVASISKLIREVVNGIRTDAQVDLLKGEIAKMLNAGAEAILLGCAELEMLLAEDRDRRFIRPLELTIENVMQDKLNEL